MPDATGYGRIVRDGGTGVVTAIVEHKDASDAERAIKEINSGVFAFDGPLLADALGKVRTDNARARSTSPTFSDPAGGRAPCGCVRGRRSP